MTKEVQSEADSWKCTLCAGRPLRVMRDFCLAAPSCVVSKQNVGVIPKVQYTFDLTEILFLLTG